MPKQIQLKPVKTVEIEPENAIPLFQRGKPPKVRFCSSNGRRTCCPGAQAAVCIQSGSGVRSMISLCTERSVSFEMPGFGRGSFSCPPMMP